MPLRTLLITECLIINQYSKPENDLEITKFPIENRQNYFRMKQLRLSTGKVTEISDAYKWGVSDPSGDGVVLIGGGDEEGFGEKATGLNIFQFLKILF